MKGQTSPCGMLGKHHSREARLRISAFQRTKPLENPEKERTCKLRYDINNGITLCHAHHPRKRADEAKLSPYFKELVAETTTI